MQFGYYKLASHQIFTIFHCPVFYQGREKKEKTEKKDNQERNDRDQNLFAFGELIVHDNKSEFWSGITNP